MLYIKQTNREEKLTRVLGSSCQVIDPWSCSQHTHIRTKQTHTLIGTCLRVTRGFPKHQQQHTRTLKFDQDHSGPAPVPRLPDSSSVSFRPVSTLVSSIFLLLSVRSVSSVRLCVTTGHLFPVFNLHCSKHCCVTLKDIRGGSLACVPLLLLS